MIYTPKPTTQFKKDVRTIEKRGYSMKLLTEVIEKLANGEVLDESYSDHPLKGNYAECRECHITPDWLLIYRISDKTLFLYLTRTGTHSDLF